MTQGRLGDALGVSERQVQRWEAGDFPIPPPVERPLEIVNDPEFFRLRVARLMRGEPVGDELKVAARAVDPDDADDPLEQIVEIRVACFWFDDRLLSQRLEFSRCQSDLPSVSANGRCSIRFSPLTVLSTR
jgi:transcriptional regulator with XRE-family HTH domain